jgi:hypothetical protein
MGFYNRNKLSVNPNMRFDISIASSGEKGGEDVEVYRCVLVGLEVLNNSTREGATSNISYNYMMSLIGVEKKK